MRIALQIKKDYFEEIKTALQKRGFKTSETSNYYTIWVYGLDFIDWCNKSIDIRQKGSIQFYNIYLEDLEYFEIEEEK